MSDARFGADADPPTNFEHQLLQQSTSLDDIWVLIGREIGLDALFRVFAMASGEILSVPTRRSFVKRMYIPQRDQEILELRRKKVPTSQLASDYGMTQRGIQRAHDRALRTRSRGR